MTEIAERTPVSAIVSRVRSDDFKQQIAIALPGNVTPDRFVRATVTALMQNPDIAKADQGSLLLALVRCAQDGLLPDGKEAALILFGNKATYLSMIGGLRKIAAEHGWQLATSVVYENDTFDYELGLSPTVLHKPARLGTDRGKPIGAYAVASHKDGRKVMEVMTAQEIEKVRQASRSKNSGPWVQWTDRMWEKTCGRRLFSKLPLSDADREQLDLVASAGEFEDPIGALYGPDAPAISPPDFDEVTGDVVENGVYEEPDVSADPAVAAGEDMIAAEQALALLVPVGKQKGRSLRQLLDDRPASDAWWENALVHSWADHDFGVGVWAVARAFAPDLMGEGTP